MAEKKVIELEVKSDSLGSLKSQLRAAQNEVNELAAKFGATSQEAVNAAKRAAELKDAIGDAKALTDAFNPDAKFNALSSSIGGALNGFQAFEGALGLVGVESENVQKTLLKVQSAMALSQGIQGLMEAKDSFKQLGAVAADALKGIRTGLAATGIGLLVVALGTIVAYWDDIKSAVSGVSAEQEALNAKSQKDVDLQKEKLESLDSQDNVLKLQGLTEKQILQLKIKQTDEAIKAYEISIKNQEQTLKAQIEAEKRNKEILKGILKFILAPINLILKTVDGIGSFLGKDWNLQDQVMDWTASLIFDPKEVKDEGMKDIAESKKALAELKNQQAGFKLEIQAIDKAAADARKQAQKEAAEKAKEAAEKEAEAKKEALEKIKEAEKEYRLYQMTEQDKEIFEANEKYNELVKQAKKYGKDTTQLEEARRNALNDITAKYIQTELDLQEKVEADKKAKDKAEKDRLETLRREQIGIEEAFYDEYNAALLTQQQTEVQVVTDKYFRLIEEAKKYGLSTIELEEKMNKEVADINKKYSETTKAQKIQAVQDTLSTIGNLAILFAGKSEKQQKKAFEIQKAVNIANATIDTYKAATGAYASLSGIPVVGPVLGAAAAAAAIAAGLVNVKNIASQKFEGGGSTPSPTPAPSGGGGGGGGVITPNFNVVGNAQATNPLAGLGSQPLQAYVVSGEVTSAQSLDRNRINYATFG